MQETFLILDTETTKEGEGMPYQSVFDIGWAISDKKGNILIERSYMVEQFKFQALNKKRAFLIDENVVDGKIYFTKLLEKRIIVSKWANIIGQLKKDCKKYNVAYIGAYNLGFDTRVIAKTHFFFSGKDFDFFDNFFLIDIYPVAAYTVLNTPEYKEFAKTHNLLTEKGNYQTGAESTYKFLFNDTSYIEEHTALQDSIDETKILHCLLNQEKEIPIHAYSINPQAWRIVNEENLNKKKS